MAPSEIERPSGDVGLRLTYAEIATRLGISGDAARQLVRRRGWLRIVPNRRGATTTVIVPEGELAGEQWRDTRSVHNGGMTPDSNRHELRAALTLVERIRIQLIEADKRADSALALADRTLAQLADTEAAQVVLREAHAAEIATLREHLAHSVTLIDGFRERADRAEAAATNERQQADTLRTTIDELKAGQALMLDMHARELMEVRAAATETRERLQRVQDAAEALRRADEDRKARGRWARLRAGWSGR